MERFWNKVDRRNDDECWPWTASKLGGGYGCFGLNGKNRPAHRVAYELLVGPIPEGLQLDHLCRNRLCVNPAHLEPVTARVNLMRGSTLAAENANKTHCPAGHPYDDGNVYVCKRGIRQCRACSRIRKREQYRAKTGLAAEKFRGPRNADELVTGRRRKQPG